MARPTSRSNGALPLLFGNLQALASYLMNLEIHEHWNEILAHPEYVVQVHVANECCCYRSCSGGYQSSVSVLIFQLRTVTGSRQILWGNRGLRVPVQFEVSWPCCWHFVPLHKVQALFLYLLDDMCTASAVCNVLSACAPSWRCLYRFVYVAMRFKR
jgi:hypothetical protein